MNENQLTIDLSKEKFNFSAIPNLHEITSIRFVNYTDKIEIPIAIKDNNQYFFSQKQQNEN